MNQLNSIVSGTTKNIDWINKSNMQAELKLRLRSLLEAHQLPIFDEVFAEIFSRVVNACSSPKPYWFLGASYGNDSEVQTERFLNNGIWQNGSEDKCLDKVRLIKPGD